MHVRSQSTVLYRTVLQQLYSMCMTVHLFQVIYMARNPKDLVVSYYQFHRSLRTMSYRGTFQEFCRRFMNDKRKYAVSSQSVTIGVLSPDYWQFIQQLWVSLSLSLKVGYGSWFEHVQEFWEHRMNSNVLFLKYEDMYKVKSSLPLAYFNPFACLFFDSMSYAGFLWLFFHFQP